MCLSRITQNRKYINVNNLPDIHTVQHLRVRQVQSKKIHNMLVYMGWIAKLLLFFFKLRQSEVGMNIKKSYFGEKFMTGGGGGGALVFQPVPKQALLSLIKFSYYFV